MRPNVAIHPTAHKSQHCVELVCSNSLGSNLPDSSIAMGLISGLSAVQNIRGESFVLSPKEKRP